MNALATAPAATLEQIPLEKIEVGTNVRIEPGELVELAASIREHGVLQPVKAVGPDPSGRYRLVFGQRRFMASQIAEQRTIPAFVEAMAEANAPGPRRSIEQLIENLHRADLNSIDRARAMREVVDAGVTQAELARELGLNPSTVANDLGLLEAPEPVQEHIRAGRLTASHAKAMKGLAPKTQKEFAKAAIERGYSAHRLEEEVQRHKQAAEELAKRERADAERVKKDLEQLDASIVELAAKKKPGLDGEIVVFQDYYGQGDVKISALTASLKKAGFTNVRAAKSHGEVEPRPKGCDCATWRATLRSSYSYGSGGYTTKLSVTPACVKPKHRQDKAAADAQAEREKYALQASVQSHVKATASGWGLPDARAIAVDRILAEAALFSLLNYRLPQWSIDRGGAGTKPWATIHGLTDAELGKELAAAIADDFRDHAGYHVDWTLLATELGLVDADATPAKGKKA